MRPSAEGSASITPQDVWLLTLIRRAFDYHQNPQRRPAPAAFKTPLWTFVHHIRSHHKLSAYTPADAFALVTSALNHMTRVGGSDSVWTKVFPTIKSPEDAEVEFLNCWESVKFLRRDSILEEAIRAAREEPLLDVKGRGAAYCRLLNVAAHLQRLLGEEPILLPCVRVAELMCLAPLTISRCRRWAVEDGYLTLVTPHRFRGGNGLATTFKFGSVSTGAQTT